MLPTVNSAPRTRVTGPCHCSRLCDDTDLGLYRRGGQIRHVLGVMRKPWVGFAGERAAWHSPGQHAVRACNAGGSFLVEKV